jgi:hypothetical protein
MKRKRKVNLVLYGDGPAFRFSVPLRVVIGHDIIEYNGVYYKYDRYDFGVGYYRKARMYEVDDIDLVPGD